MKIKYRFLLGIWMVIFIVSLIFTFHTYAVEKEALLNGIDQKLYTAATMLSYVLPSDYHDNLNSNSFTPEEYDLIVDRNNKICSDLGLQYIWSNMIVDEKIVFTTSSSPSRNISKKDYALFFSVHSDPPAFDEVFANMEVTYHSFKNEWGNGRMVLVPHVDKNGRKYVFGASIGTNEVFSILFRSILRNLIFFLLALAGGFGLSIFLANSLTSKISQLAYFATRFKKGEEITISKIKNSDEIGELAKVLNTMVQTVKANELKLKKQTEDLDKRVKSRTTELEKFNKAAVGRELKMVELKKKIKELESQKK